MFYYTAYGVAIVSDAPMPELTASGTRDTSKPKQVTVALCAQRPHAREPSEWLNVGFDECGKPWFKCARIDDGYLLRYSELADFLIASDGSQIRCVYSNPKISALTVRHLLLDQAFPRLLNLLGREALHATAIASPAGVCAFIAGAGTGKSTLAASFQIEGYRSVCDDCLVVEEDAGQIIATPGYPGVRLWPDSLAAVGGANAQTKPVADYTSKWRLFGAETTDRFVTKPGPLRRIYSLKREESVRALSIEEATPAEIFPELIGSSFPLDISDKVMLERHFRLFSRVASQVPARRLCIPDDFAALAEVRQAILADVGVA